MLIANNELPYYESNSQVTRLSRQVQTTQSQVFIRTLALTRACSQISDTNIVATNQSSSQEETAQEEAPLLELKRPTRLELAEKLLLRENSGPGGSIFKSYRLGRYYHSLNLKYDATEAELNSNYRKLSCAHHPDRWDNRNRSSKGDIAGDQSKEMSSLVMQGFLISNCSDKCL